MLLIGSMFKDKETPAAIDGEGYLIIEAIKYGDSLTRLSALIFGLGNLLRGQAVRFLLYLAAELSYIIFMIL